MTYQVQHAVNSSALNHHVVVLSIQDGNTIWEYTWNHSVNVELWKCSVPPAPTPSVHVFPTRQLIAVIPAAGADGEWATLMEAKSVAQMHVARNIDITNRVLTASSVHISREQF